MSVKVYSKEIAKALVNTCGKDCQKDVLTLLGFEVYCTGKDIYLNREYVVMHKRHIILFYSVNEYGVTVSTQEETLTQLNNVFRPSCMGTPNRTYAQDLSTLRYFAKQANDLNWVTGRSVQTYFERRLGDSCMKHAYAIRLSYVSKYLFVMLSGNAFVYELNCHMKF